jgi:hypothetical protein
LLALKAFFKNYPSPKRSAKIEAYSFPAKLFLLFSPAGISIIPRKPWYHWRLGHVYF